METRKRKGKGLDKKKGVKIEEVNVTHNKDSDGDKTSSDIFYTNFDPMFLTTKDGYAMSDWILDFGASLHVSPDREWFTTYVATKDFVRLGNDQTCPILGIGDDQLKF